MDVKSDTVPIIRETRGIIMPQCEIKTALPARIIKQNNHPLIKCPHSRSKNGCGCCEKWINYVSLRKHKTSMRYHRKCYENHTAASNFSCSVIWRKRNELEAALILSSQDDESDIVGHTNRDLNLLSVVRITWITFN